METTLTRAAPASEAAARRRRPLRWIAAGALLAALLLAFRQLPIEAWLHRFQGLVQELGPAGYLLYALVYALAVVLFVPASVLTLGAGAIYGLGAGVGVVLLGATAGATLAFLLARTLLRRRVERMAASNPRFRALDRAIAREGARIVFLVRLAPVFPFTYVNFAFGLTGVRTLGYVVATAVGMIPGTFAYVYLGTLGASAAAGEAASATQWLLRGMGAVVAVGVTAFVARVASRAIREAGIDEDGPAA